MKTFIQIIVLFCTLNLAGQGAHYSLIHSMNQYINPALVGDGIEENKLSSNFRRQWSALGFSYNSSNIKFEKKMENISIGGLFQNNNAGSNTIKDNLFEFSLGYHSPLSSYSRLSFGLGLGLFEQSFNPTNLTFENQYQLEIGYNAGLSNRENFETTKIITPEISAGINLELFNDDVISVSLGVGFKSLLANKNIFNSLEAIENHNKVNVNFQSKWNVSPTYQVQTFILKSNKVRADELMVLIRNKFLVSKDVEVFFGGGIRNKDAVICDIGFKKGNINLALAHDISISRLYNTSSTEISIALAFGKVKRKRIIKKTEPEEKLMIVKDTIIDNDFDNDGIVNGLDLCPYEFGMKKHKGCPFNDIDRDGVTDDKDLCPNLFGAGTLSGCPDSDKDGISDHIDKCPQNPGSVLNGGCPEVRYIQQNKIDQKEDDNIKELDTLIIYFEENSIQIEANYKIGIIQFIKNISTNHILIINGHTNDNGSDYYNKNLGDLRSKSVMTFLKELGVNNNIIVPVSYGENKPYLSNQSIVGKTLNRRVELVKLKKQ
jgi:type IX secretion system PorP/SprF family membrane protein